MRRLLFGMLAVMLPLCLLTDTNEAQDAADAFLKTVDLSEWDAWFQQEEPEIPFRPSDFVAGIVSMEDPVGSDDIADRVTAFILPSLKKAAGKLILLLGIAVLAGVLNGIHKNGGAAETAQTAFRFASACIVLTIAAGEIKGVCGTVLRISALTDKLLPVLLGFLMLGGMEHTAGILTPSFVLFSDIAIRVLQRLIVPVACAGGVLSALDACASGRLASLGKLFLRASKWLLGIVCTGYGLLSAVRGVAASGADGVLMKSAKFAAGSLPTVGGVVSDSVDTVYQCMLFVKSALGVGGAALILLAAARPVLNLFLTRCSLRAASAISEPLSGKPYADLLRVLGDTLHVMLLTELAAAAMACMAVAPVILGGRGV